MNVYQIAKPFSSNAERLVSEALASSQAPAAEIQQIRPPLLQVQPFPPRFGYPDMQSRQSDVEDVLDVARLYGDAREDMSGGPSGYQGSSRNVQSDCSW